MTDLPAQFDPTRLDRLLALVGPALAADLLQQLDADLSACAGSIADGAKSQDWTLLREATHVLISLAGSAGAAGLHRMAQSLNAAAHAKDDQVLSDLLPNLTRDLDALIALVRNPPLALKAQP